MVEEGCVRGFMTRDCDEMEMKYDLSNDAASDDGHVKEWSCEVGVW